MNELEKSLKSLLSFDFIDENQRPIMNPLIEQLRNLPALNWNSKVLGGILAENFYKYGAGTNKSECFAPFVPGWKAVKYEDYLQEWFFHTCEALKRAPLLHRKLWEDAYIVNSLLYFEKLKSGMKGIAFGVGTEPLPSYFASLGARIYATDLDISDQSAKGWVETNQHGSLEKLFKPELINSENFEKLVSFEYADMNKIPVEYSNEFDFCWSVCALEHLGSIELGLKFIEESYKVLKPGGVAVHTTEFNFHSDTGTIDNWGTVLFRKQDFLKIYERLSSLGARLPEISFDVGNQPIDAFVDIPPYPGHSNYYLDSFTTPHLKLVIDGYPCTCFGISFQKPL